MIPSPPLRAIVTAGGTSEPIDGVRVVTNLSEGRFGASIANALVQRGVEVTVLGSRPMHGHPEWLDPRVRCVPFGSHADLAIAIAEHTRVAPDLFFMAAAVSDYAPRPVEGKIRSDADSLTVQMERTPKLLSKLRQQCGPDAILIGFKLLSGVNPEELVAVAHRQCVQNELDLTIANDAATFGPGSHPIAIVAPDGSAEHHRGTKDQVAIALVERVLRSRPCPTPWQQLEAGLRRASPLAAEVDLAPWFDRGVPVGATVHTSAGVGFWITPAARGRGLGDRLIRELGEVEPTVIAPAPLEDLLVRRGYRTLDRTPGRIVAQSPCARSDLVPAASMALVHPATRAILLGRRRTGPSTGTWSMPGGHLEPDETAATAARRELSEETGLIAPTGLPLAVSSVVVGHGDCAWRITSFAHAVLDRPEPRSTAEFEARWVPVDELGALGPLASGTRYALGRLFSVLGWGR